MIYGIALALPAIALSPTGNNPATWPLNEPWHDNLGALFAHPTQAGNPVRETIYSTSTVDTSVPGTTTIDYWAQIAGSDWLHATRDLVIRAPANDNAASSTAPANAPPAGEAQRAAIGR